MESTGTPTSTTTGARDYINGEQFARVMNLEHRPRVVSDGGGGPPMRCGCSRSVTPTCARNGSRLAEREARPTSCSATMHHPPDDVYGHPGRSAVAKRTRYAITRGRKLEPGHIPTAITHSMGKGRRRKVDDFAAARIRTIRSQTRTTKPSSIASVLQPYLVRAHTPAGQGRCVVRRLGGWRWRRRALPIVAGEQVIYRHIL